MCGTAAPAHTACCDHDRKTHRGRRKLPKALGLATQATNQYTTVPHIRQMSQRPLRER
eukprot:CAMPEP_0119367110 /NCGR_PEP_ID=MMETSP1334-20130426/13917_1 /TAXON_ID=127549 /ORGANISM="Calcidiscus leptoporus, Strain RCC1130" /LENGTH=57 /DNA_ID=CAMNT_0007383445 /DNA_START=160 /DNA_END=333 /DNA_ORIENTATION=+